MTEQTYLKKLRKSAKLSQEKLAELCEVSRPAVTQWELGNTEPRWQHIQRLAEIFGVDPGFLRATYDKPYDYELLDAEALANKQKIEGIQYTRSDNQPDQHEAEFIGDIDPWDSNTPLHEDEVELPFFREVELAAGNGMTQVIENHGLKLRFSKATLRRVGVQEGHAACATIIGNSMEPMLPHGCTVGIDTLKTQVTDGKIFAIDHGGMLRVKLLYRLPGGGIRIKSFNTEEHPDESLTAEQAKTVRVLGKVFWYSGLLD